MSLFSFDTTIPAANNNPSSDQPIMQNNNVSTNGLLSIDHITFNANNGGQHKQITFNQDASYVPVPPVSPPVLFTDIIAGLPQLKFYSGDATHSSSQYVVGGTGSTFLLGGIILKWGGISGVMNNQGITFTPHFPNNVFSLIVGGGTASSTNQPIINFDQATLSVAGFTTKIIGTTPINYYYIAIGN